MPPRGRPLGRPPNVPARPWDAVEFIRAWYACDSQFAVAATLDRTQPEVSHYATRLRKAGVKLPRHSRRSRAHRFDVSGLNAMIEELERDGE